MRTVFEFGFGNDFRGPSLGQDFGSLISIIPQLVSTGISAYGAKRTSDQAKLDKSRAEKQQQQAAAAQAAADAARAKALQDQMLQQQAVASSNAGTGMGMNPMILAVGALGLVGIGALLVSVAKKKK